MRVPSVGVCLPDLNRCVAKRLSFQVRDAPAQLHELAFRMGVNLVMYALCLDYKTDQVHVPFIMRRRRWKPDDGAAVPAAPPTPRKP